MLFNNFEIWILAEVVIYFVFSFIGLRRNNGVIELPYRAFKSEKKMN